MVVRDWPVSPRGGCVTVTWPATGEELKAAGYQSTGRDRCKSCGAEIVWATHPKTGRHLALELVPDDDPEIRRYQGHFTTCFAAATHRRKRPGSGQTLPVHKEA